MADSIPQAAPRATSLSAGIFLSIVGQLLFQLAAGIVLSLRYSADILTAHGAAVQLHSGAIGYLQAIHYWGSALLILESGLFLFYLAWQGRYRNGDRWQFWSCALVFLCAYGFQVSGNVLPMDKHGVETVVVETGIMARLPVVGSALKDLALQGNQFGAGTLHLWYSAHWLLAVLALLAIGLAYRARREEQSEVSNRFAFGVVTLLPLVVAAGVRSPLGSAATSDDFGEFGARVSWYTWPLHGALSMTDRLGNGFGWIGAMLVPALALIFVLALPWLGMRLKPVGARVGLSLIVLFFGVAALGFGGSFAPLTGTRDPIVVASTGPTKPFDLAAEARGLKLIQAQGCENCHGKNLVGDSGPALNKEGHKHSDAAFFVKYIHAPTSVDPQSTMPPFPQLTQSELADIAEYLRSRQ